MQLTRQEARRLCTALGVAVMAVSPAASAATVDSWYVITIAGSPVGSVRTVVSADRGETIEIQEMHLVLNRMGTLVEMSSMVETREDAAGRLLTADIELDMSSQTTTMGAVVEAGRVRIADGAGGATFSREIEYAGDLLGPTGARRLIREGLRQVGDRVGYQTFRVDLGSVVEIGLELVDREGGLMKVEETMTGMPIATVYWLDDEAKIVRSSMPSPFGQMETIRADAATARRATAGNELPEESYGATLAEIQVRLPQPRRASRVLLELRHRSPALGWPELTAPGQTVLEQAEARLLLEVRRVEQIGAVQFPVSPDKAAAEYLAANAYIQSDDREVVALARRIVGDTVDIFSALELLERWTAENMSFDMGVVMAPSTEVLENRRGTCTEYAVLLTTLARALGIPSRFVMGYVYVGGIYGGHAWTEVLIGDQWVGFDGAVPADGPVDAARIAFLWSSLAEGIGALHIGPGMQMYGQIDLAALEYGLESGEEFTYSADDDGIEIDGAVYRNRSLDVSWSRPADFSFSDTDLTWPDTGLVTLEGPDGASATLSVRDRRYWVDSATEIVEVLKRAAPEGEIAEMLVAGHEARGVVSDHEAALALVRGSELWLLEVEGAEAGERLAELAAGLSL